jgi:RNA recognition motif-containing protein
MTDPATQERRTYRSAWLSEDDNRLLDELGNHLVTNPFDYTSHVRFLMTLQAGFASHVQNGGKPTEYELLQELRDARKQMDQIFPLGEQLWISWLDDETALAANVDERLRLMDLFARAVTDEPSSVRLWRKYGDYTYTLWATAYGVGEAASVAATWPAHELQKGQDYFKWEPMLRIWEQGVAHTHFRLNDSHLVWDQYIGVLIQDHEKWPNAQKLANIKHKFSDRLAEAHSTWDTTYQNFGSFLSTHDPKGYEETMASMSRNRGAQTAWRLREKFEQSLQQAAESGNETAEYEAYTEYLNWELQKKGVFSFRMINSLYERATIRFPSVQSFWIDFVDFLISEQQTPPDIDIMAVIERATRHCPWSGDLWAHRLLTMEAEGRDFPEMEHVKHRATATGLLDVGGMEELMKVYVAWCGGLRRRAFAVGASEDELDIAEVAIRSALEHVKKIGHDKYADKYTGDPHYRLERIYIKFMMQKGEIDVARDSWKEILKVQVNSYDFWYRFYMWEMVVWAKFAIAAANDPETQLQAPVHATAVLKEALEHVDTMDWPEQLVTMFLNHCEHHENVPELRRAVIRTREVNRLIAKRREKEALAAQQEAVAAQASQVASQDVPMTNGKRKRGSEASEAAGTETSAKKTRSNEPEGGQEEVQPSTASTAQPKRDREHTTIIVSHIPPKTTEGQVKHFFRDSGVIKSLKLVSEKNATQTATIEFETQEEASYSLMKAGKSLNGAEIKVKFGTGCTLFVTNYPPEANKQYLRDLFAEFGEIVDVRMPSLKANTTRRFAYLQFLDPTSASRAVDKLNDTPLEEGKYTLKVAVSDPSKAGERTGPQAEGREVFIGNVYWYCKEDELRTLFSSVGGIESVRIAKTLQGKSKGHAFVDFSTKEEAERAVKEYNDTEFKGRTLHLEISTRKGTRIATHVNRDGTGSPAPESAGSPAVLNGARSATGDPEPGAKDHKERTIALLNVPDTVTAARLEKLVVEHAGAIKKFTLRPDHAGAIVEFADVSSVGKAQMALQDFELEEKKISVGTVPELMKQAPEDKQEKPKPKPKKGEKKTFGAPVARPAQGGASVRGRGGRRGGLGFVKRTAGMGTGKDGGEGEGPKSNDYFKQLMEKNAGPAADRNADAKAQPLKESKKAEAEDGDLLDDIMGDDDTSANGGVQHNGDAGEDDGLLDDLMDD